MSKTSQILTSPLQGTTVAPVYNYTEEQQAQIKALREYATTLQLPEDDPYHPWELRFLDRPGTVPRYMRAAKWKLEDAKKRIEKTMEWRRDFKPDLIQPEEVRTESERGGMILNGFDKDGRPILYIRPGRENAQGSIRQLRHLVWCLERAIDLMPPGQESVMMIADYKSTTLRSSPSISAARTALTVLHQHYAGALGRSIVVNLPTLLNFFFKGVSPFMDPAARDEVLFNPNLLELVPKEQLDAEFGGDYEYEFEPASYWEQIVSKCRIAADGTRLPEGSGSSDLLYKSPDSALAAQTNVGDQKESVLAGLDPIPEAVSVH